MPIYLCRTDGYDLTAQVERALRDTGGDVANMIALVHGRSLTLDAASEREFLFDGQVLDGRADLVDVVVTCPKDTTDNRFWVQKDRR